MFNADKINPDIDIKELFSKVSEYDIFKKYCTNFEEIDKSFLSEFYNDTNPGCRIYQNKNNKLYYKDFGNGDHLGCINYVMKKYYCNFKEALNIISNDFGLLTFNLKEKPEFILSETITNLNKPKFKPFITINSRNWNITDYNYWSKYNITFDLLEKYDVIPCKNIYLHKLNKTIVFNNTDSNPIYAYRFTHEGKYSYKIYFPLNVNKKHKWLFSGGYSENIEGFDQLPLFGDLLIITKSLKDIICCKLCGYDAISLQGEANKLSIDLMNKLKKRFNNFILFYDNDEQGIKSAHKITSNYDFKSIIIPLEYDCKDLSELIAKNGLNEANVILNKLINDTIN